MEKKDQKVCPLVMLASMADEAMIFNDPKKEMYQGTFLSLKPYMKYFDIDILEEKILSAGMANEEQILLPMTYDYFLYAFTTDAK